MVIKKKVTSGTKDPLDTPTSIIDWHMLVMVSQLMRFCFILFNLSFVYNYWFSSFL